MNQEEKIRALKDAILEANTKATFGLYRLKNKIVDASDLDTLTEALDILEAGFNLKNFMLTERQRKLIKAYDIDIEQGKTISKDNINEIIEERK